MTYATRQSMIDQYGEDELIGLTDRTGADVIDDTRLQSAIDDAIAEVNGYLSRRPGLPLDPVPRIIERHTRTIAYYVLFAERGTTDIPEPRNRYKDAIAFLKEVAAGTVSLGDENAEDGVDATPGAVATDAPERLFTRDTMRSW